MGAGRLAIAFEDLDLTGNAVFQNGHVVEKIERLKHHAHVRAVRGAVEAAAQDVFSMIEDLAGSGCLQQIETAQQSGFAGAGSADNADHVSPVHGEIYVSEHLVGAEGFGQVIYLQNELAHTPPPFVSADPPRRSSVTRPCRRASSCSTWRRSSSRIMLFAASGFRSSKGVRLSG